jgi:hypothetical protein
MSTAVAHELNDADEAILERLLKGRNTPQNLADGLGYSRQYIQNRLQMLKAADHVVNRGGGLYEITPDGRGEISAEADLDEPELRARLQDALEARDDAQARPDRLEAELEDCREQLERARSEDAVALDHEQLHEWIDSGLSRLPDDAPGRTRIEDVRARLEEAIGDA